MTKTLSINGTLHETKLFKTLKSAKNYADKNELNILYFRSGEYYVG